MRQDVVSTIMTTQEKYDSLLNEAKTMYALGHDNKYIEFQFADKGVDDNTIDNIIKDINSVRRHNKKSRGRKLVIYGLSFLGVAFLFTLISYNAESPTRFVLWGLAISGVTTLIKGLADMMGL
jgi:hypothetical protein